MEVKLLHYTPLWVCSRAIRTCWDSHDKSDTRNGVCGEADKEIIDRVGNKNKHASTLEHLSFNFEIKGISRACLQELARHRIASYSVQSTRYTLKKYLKNEEEFKDTDFERASKYIVLTNIESVDKNSIQALENLRKLVLDGGANDKIKYIIPECFKTSLIWSINARSLQNFLSLRSSKHALWEIRQLAFNIHTQLPEDYKYLFDACINNE